MKDCDIVLSFMFVVCNVADSSSNYTNSSSTTAILVSLNLLKQWQCYWSRDPLSTSMGYLHAKHTLAPQSVDYPYSVELSKNECQIRVIRHPVLPRHVLFPIFTRSRWRPGRFLKLPTSGILHISHIILNFALRDK